ncbi:uncharacterized protein DUF349 [Chromohalobacter marismortui]|uniref:Uncharacterized protein DUF349 n=1 Tax=Chromohalobacter marismortui TaxID=42055 RepID=A0A4R7NHY9_9GAMM|nr:MULTISPECIES: DUF349 domain-containing protein [Chromohalobacter]MCI0510834.1 DUF349 domain-containing protein [Chromohalobacter sp.]MCI0592700.1 DUF349 domain-containing protein [Chromohalobacter sp.]TDU20234.1 uncharacterized protein DUF349 [Chromohalobacter marismortui]
MSGFFRRFFAPRWQHRDPRVRHAAIAQLDSHKPTDRHALERLTRDEDASVRREALTRFVDPSTLLEWLATHDTPELRVRLAQLLSGSVPDAPPLQQRLDLLDRLGDHDLLVQLVETGDNQELRLAALAKLDDEATLLQQARDNGIAVVRHAAAERVSSTEGLQRLAREARRDKVVVRKARERLQRQRADAAEAQAQQAARQRILDALEAHALHAWEPLYGARYRHLVRDWEALGDTPSDEQERRFQEASQRCRKTLSDHETEGHAQHQAIQRQKEATRTRQELVEALEDAVTGLQQASQLTHQDLESLRAQQRLHSERWLALSDHYPPDEDIQTRYAEAQAKCQRIGDAWDRASAQAQPLETALRDDHAAVDACLAQIDWPDDLPPTPLIHEARQLRNAEAAETSAPIDLSALRADLDKLENQLDRGTLKTASRLYRQIRQRVDDVPSASRGDLEARLKRLGARLAELRDWRGFVAGPKRTQLLESIEALADDSESSDAERDRRHRQLIKEWAALGDAAATAELSQRFRSASQRIHAALNDWYQQRDAARTRNLEAREALCEQLEELITHPDPQADPDVLRQIRDRAREQWQQCSPVPREHAKPLGQRFGRIRHELQALIDRRANEIGAAKRDLIAEADALIEADMPSSQRTEAAKALQSRWRELGRAAKGEEQMLWRHFRGLCDRIFAAREAERENRAQKAQTRLDSMQALIDRFDAWQPQRADDSETLESAVRDAEALEPLPGGRRSEGMRRRWQGIVRARRERLAQLALGAQAARWRQLRPLLDAHVAADDAALNDDQTADVTLPEAMPQDLRGAHAARNAARREGDSETANHALGRLVVQVALIADEPVAAQEEPLRLEVQVARLNNGLGQAPQPDQELADVLRQLLETGPISSSVWTSHVTRLDALFDVIAQRGA